jgi:hypothetical protein
MTQRKEIQFDVIEEDVSKSDVNTIGTCHLKIPVLNHRRMLS